MSDVEETLRRELHDVAASVAVPERPHLLPAEPEPAPGHRWTWLAAAAVVVVAGTALAAFTATRGTEHLQPAPAPPTTLTISTAAPSVPYVLGTRLYVEGSRVPGQWHAVRSGPSGWVALGVNGRWSWGWSASPHTMESSSPERVPVISPNGRYVAEITTENGRALLTGFDTRPAGEGLGGIPIDAGDPQDGSQVTVRAVTDDGWVIAQGTRTAVLWLPATGESVNLAATAPGQQIEAATAAGLVVTDESTGESYLASMSPTGRLHPLADLPAHDDLSVSPDGQWYVWTGPGTTGGDTTSIPSLHAQAIKGEAHLLLTPPDGWSFAVRSWVWEDGEHLISAVRDQEGLRMARCSVAAGRCELLEPAG